MAIDTNMNISPILGTNNNDDLQGTGRSEVLSGAGGDDIITALSGNDEVFGGTGNDTLHGQGGNDVIYGNGKPAYVDMDNLTIANETTATVTFVDEGAGYRNALGVYEVAQDGTISNVQVLFPNASKIGSGGSLRPEVSNVQFEVAKDAQLGFFIVSNGYGKSSKNQEALEATDGYFALRTPLGEPATIASEALELWHIDPTTGQEVHIKSQYGYDLFHSLGNSQNDYSPNPDNFLHVVGRANTLTGEILIGFEDLFGGGDKDYDDTVIRIDIGRENVTELLPESSPSAAPLPDDDIIYGGDGNDTIFGVSGSDLIFGGFGNDELSGNSGNDRINGDSGDDELFGNSGDDYLSGGYGGDTLNGNSGDDSLYGGSGNDTLYGGSGADLLEGGSNNDTLSGGSGNDTLDGGSGNDTLNGNSGNDIINGGFGADILNGHSGDDTLFGGNGKDKLIGGGGHDKLDGGANNDKIYGGSGDDILFGSDGNDYLTGGSGEDTLNGGAGNDKLRGGSGADTFAFDFSHAGIGNDTIYDFTEFDTIMLINSFIDTFDDLMTNCTETATGCTFDFAEDQAFTIRNIEITDLSSDLFILG